MMRENARLGFEGMGNIGWSLNFSFLFRLK